MDIRDLKYFETIADYGHVGKAAEHLFLTQPALTRAVRRLEEDLGAALFERSGRGIKLTPMGAMLLEKAKTLRHIVDDTQRELRDFAQGNAGHIRLGCSPTVGSWLLSAPMKALREQAPGVTFDITFAMGKSLMDLLYAHHLDLVISYVSGPVKEGYSSAPLFTDAVVVAASESHPVFSGPYTLQSLDRYGWILPAQSMFTRNWLEKTLSTLHLPPPKVYVETNTMLYTFDMAVKTQCFCFLSRRNLAYFGGGSSFRELILPEVTLNRIFSLAHRTDGYLSPAVSRFIAVVKDFAKEHALCAKSAAKNGA